MASLVAPALARETNIWQSVGGSYDGKWSEVGHWSLGRLPAGDDYIVFDGDHSDNELSYAVEVDGDYSVGGELCIGANDVTRPHALTFTGNGSVTFSLAGVNHNVRCCSGGVTFSGPSFSFKTANHVLLFSPVTVKDGANLNFTGPIAFWHWQAALTVDADGRVETQWIQVRTGQNSGGLTVNAGGSFVCRGKMIHDFPSGTLATRAFFIDVNGGDVWCQDLDFSLRGIDTVTVRNGGWLCVWKSVAFSDRSSQLSVDAGSNFLEPSNVTQGDATYALMTNRRHVVVSCLKYNAVDGQRFRQRGTFCFSILNNATANKPMYIDCERLVFDGTAQPIAWTTLRDVHFYGPMEIRATADVTSYSNENGSRYCHGPVVVDTSDWVLPSYKRKIVIRGLASEDGSLDLTVRGGGTFETCQRSSYNSMRSCRVAADTSLILQDRSSFANYGKKVEDWGPLTAETLVLESGAKVSFKAGQNFICASKWQIDESANIAVNVPSDMPANIWAVPILQDIDSKPLPNAFTNRITLSGSTSGWSLKNEQGQITLWREPTVAVGAYSNPNGKEYEWQGGTADSGIYKFSIAGNWVDATDIAEQRKFTFGASHCTDVLFDNVPGSFTTIGQFCFQTNAVRSFFVDAANQATFQSALDKEVAIENYSAVPQVLACGMRLRMPNNATSNRVVKTRGTGPIVFSHSRADGTTLASNWQATGTDGNVTHHFKVTVDGDVRVGCGMDANRNLGLVLAPQSFLFPCYRTCLTILDGGNIQFPKQNDKMTFGNVYSSLRVSAGGQLTFPTEAHYYCWSANPAAIIVDGTLNIGTRLTGGCARQSYGGTGTINIAREIQPNGCSTLFMFGDTLQVNVFSNRWPSEGKTLGSAQLATALGAVSGTPTFHVPTDWVYGPTVASPTTVLSSRAMRLENEAVATIDPSGGIATINDCVTGNGTLAITNGTLRICAGFLNDMEDELSFWARKGATLEFTASQSFGSLTLESGSTLKMPPTGTIALDGDARIDGATVDFGNPSTMSGWQTLIMARGRIIGTPAVAEEEFKLRTVKTSQGYALQRKRFGGILIIFR